MKPRPNRHRPRSHRLTPTIPAGGIVLLALIGTVWHAACVHSPNRPDSGSRAKQQILPGDLRDKLDQKRAKGPKRPDQPDAAAQIFMDQRLPPGETDLPLQRLRDELTTIRTREAAARNQLAPAGDLPRPGGILGWTTLGPGNIGGRTRALAIDPQNPSVLYAGGVAGGIWKSTDAGASWSPLDDAMLNLAITTIVINPLNTNILYAGTGEGFRNGDSVRGLGVFKSTNAGATWTQLASTVGPTVPEGAFYRVNDLALSPSDPDRIYAATRFGVWRSTDAGASWTLRLANQTFVIGPNNAGATSVGCTELAIRTDTAPVQPDVIFAAFGSIASFNPLVAGAPDGLYRSLDGGDSWTRLGTASDLQAADQGRMSLAVAPSNNDVIYVCMANNGTTNNTGSVIDVFRSIDGGDTWSPRVDLSSLTGRWLLSNLVFAAGCAGNVNFAQGWYDNVIAVDPLNADVVWVGGIDLFRSDDGGRNFGIASYWFIDQIIPGATPQFVHADQHAIVFDPNYDGSTNQRMYVGNDGGIYRTDNARAATSQEDCAFSGGTGPLPDIQWLSLNNGYGVTQYYHGDAAQDRELYAAGAQDNGTSLVLSRVTPNQWERVFGGDGGYVAVD
ncbi:MAG: hypothetical protein V3T70_00830, partial [Phycisphaerae bacterium]